MCTGRTRRYQARTDAHETKLTNLTLTLNISTNLCKRTDLISRELWRLASIQLRVTFLLVLVTLSNGLGGSALRLNLL